MNANLIKILGDAEHVEQCVWHKPTHTDDEIVVKNVMTGICSSDVAMYAGQMNMLPIHMHGHEGLGEVIAVGSNVRNVTEGDYVATRGEPAFADVYNVRNGEFVVVPEALPKYILEPVACAVNIADTARYTDGKSVLIIGTGFLARVIYQVLNHNSPNLENVTVVGNAYSDWWSTQHVSRHVDADSTFDIVIDLSGDPKWFDADLLSADGQYIMGAEKTFEHLDFAPFLWKSATIDLPSPRTSNFHQCMIKAKELVEAGIVTVDDMWSKGYNSNEASIAFSNRYNGIDKGRTYLIWQQ